MCPWLCRITHDIATHRGGLVSACPRQLRRVAALAAFLSLVAASGADVFTAQLSRSDTMPNRLSPGWVDIPGQALDVTRLRFPQ
jgi:hypothetical protein